MITIAIDKKHCIVDENQTIWEAARAQNIEIPTFCHVAELTPYGACRICLVSVALPTGIQRIVTACDTKVTEGMKIRTDTPDVLNARRHAAEMLLSCCPQHPKVKEIAAQFGVLQAAYETPLTQPDCILCGNCVRACKEKSAGVLHFAGTGQERKVTTHDGKKSSACDHCQACINTCPTTAVTRGLGLEIGAFLQQKWDRRLSFRRWVQIFFLSLFIVLMLMTIGGVQIGTFPNHLFSLMDPLQALFDTRIQRGDWLIYLPAFAILSLTLLFGRFFCGWICPAGTILQSFGFRGRRITLQSLRRLKLAIFLFLGVLAGLGVSAYLWFDPMAMLVRPVQLIVQRDTRFLWSCAPLAVALLSNLIERGFWCRYLCPLGGLLGFLARISPFTHRVDPKNCVSCGECAKICPTGAVSQKNQFTADPAECTQCMECAAQCPKHAIAFCGKKPRQKLEFRPGRGEVLLFGMLCAGAAILIILMSWS